MTTKEQIKELKIQLKKWEESLQEEEGHTVHYSLNIIGCKAMIKQITEKIKELEAQAK